MLLDRGIFAVEQLHRRFFKPVGDTALSGTTARWGHSPEDTAQTRWGHSPLPKQSCYQF